MWPAGGLWSEVLSTVGLGWARARRGDGELLEGALPYDMWPEPRLRRSSCSERSSEFACVSWDIVGFGRVELRGNIGSHFIRTTFGARPLREYMTKPDGSQPL